MYVFVTNTISSLSIIYTRNSYGEISFQEQNHSFFYLFCYAFDQT